MQDTTNLIALAQNGNPEAAGLLYDRHHPAIFRYLFYRTGDRHAAEDLTEDVFVKMVQALPGFDGGRIAFRAWIYQIARNLSIDHLRRSQAHPRQALHENMRAEAPDVERETIRRLDEAALMAALERLGDEQKDVILLRFIERLPLADTARALHKSEDAVKGLQRRALIALRTALSEEGVGDE